MLGYSSNAELTLSDNRMAKSVKNVEKMLDELTKRITPMGRKELQDLTDFKRSQKGHENDKFEKWDPPSLFSEYRKAKFGYEEEELAEYFQVEHVKEQILKIY